MCAKLTDLKRLQGDFLFTLNVQGEPMSLDIEGASKEARTPLIIHPTHRHENQLFHLWDAGDGYYAIEAAHSGLVLDVCGESTSSGSPVIQFPYHGKNNQLWRLDFRIEQFLEFLTQISSQGDQEEGQATQVLDLQDLLTSSGFDGFPLRIQSKLNGFALTLNNAAANSEVVMLPPYASDNHPLYERQIFYPEFTRGTAS